MAKVGTTVYITQDGLASLETLTRWYDNHPGTPLLVHLRGTVLANRYFEIYQKIAALLTSKRTGNNEDFIKAINTIPVQPGDSLSGKQMEWFKVCDEADFKMRRAFYLLSKCSYDHLSDFLPYETFKEKILSSPPISTPTELKKALESAISSGYASRLQLGQTFDKSLQGYFQDAIDCIKAAKASNMAAQGIEA